MTAWPISHVSALVLFLVLSITIPVGGAETAGVGVNPITNRVYVAGISSDTVSVIDGETNTVIATVPVGSGQGVDVNPITNRVYVVNNFSQTVAVIDGVTNSVIATVEDLAFRPRLVGVNPTTNRVYAGNDDDSTVSVIDGETNRVVATIDVGGRPLNVGGTPSPIASTCATPTPPVSRSSTGRQMR